MREKNATAAVTGLQGHCEESGLWSMGNRELVNIVCHPPPPRVSEEGSKAMRSGLWQEGTICRIDGGGPKQEAAAPGLEQVVPRDLEFRQPTEAVPPTAPSDCAGEIVKDGI